MRMRFDVPKDIDLVYCVFFEFGKSAEFFQWNHFYSVLSSILDIDGSIDFAKHSFPNDL